ncbi:MAG: phosphoribosylformylglycinamidine cyclo-ligase [Chitinivibrionales bacterium]
MNEDEKRPLTYADAGVDLTAWHDTRQRIGALVKATYNEHVLGGFGQFGGLFDVSMLKEYDHPVLVSSVDGVGTKLKIAFETGIHTTVGEDIVNHCIDDILVLGAKPLYFLDYVGTGKLSPEVTAGIVEGLSRACRQAGCVIIGGETAEMPGFYQAGEYDIAGTIVGVVDREKIIDGKNIRPGDVVIGLRSNGLHTNGYSLARKIVTDVAARSYGDLFEPTGKTFGEELLRPHRCYSDVLPLMERGLIKGCAHITGGGFPENIDRILPSDTNAVIDAKAWKPDPIFLFLQDSGGVENHEMYRTFNMGIGLVLVVAAEDARKVMASGEIKSFDPKIIGRIEGGNGSVQMEF